MDANFVMLEPDRFVEVQGTGEHGTFCRAELDSLLAYGERGITQLFAAAAEGARPVKLLVATRSAGKQREIRRLLADSGLDVVFPDDLNLFEDPAEELLENSDSFRANARAKAEYFAKRSGLPTVADDSGLEVFYLGGAPGHAVEAVGGRHRHGGGGGRRQQRRTAAPARGGAGGQARRRATAARWCWSGTSGRCRRCSRGSAPGRILEAPAGSGGFGYDPYFYSRRPGQELRRGDRRRGEGRREPPGQGVQGAQDGARCSAAARQRLNRTNPPPSSSATTDAAEQRDLEDEPPEDGSRPVERPHRHAVDGEEGGDPLLPHLRASAPPAPGSARPRGPPAGPPPPRTPGSAAGRRRASAPRATRRETPGTRRRRCPPSQGTC